MFLEISLYSDMSLFNHALTIYKSSFTNLYAYCNNLIIHVCIRLLKSMFICWGLANSYLC